LAHGVQKTKKETVGRLCANRKNVPPVVKNKQLMNGEYCGQHSNMVALAWQNKQVSTISTYHKDELPVKVKFSLCLTN
jgi:hypothetical protein